MVKSVNDNRQVDFCRNVYSRETMRQCFVAAFTRSLPFALAGCIAFVSVPDVSDDTCRVRGDEKPCGACVASRCGAQVRACCGDKVCDATLSLLEACSDPGGGPECASLLNAAQGTGEGSALQTCIREKCGAFCQSVSGRSNTACQEPAGAAGTSCSCVMSSTPNDVVCSAASVPSTLCCAPSTWPAEGQACKCEPLNCVPTTAGCTCGLLSYRSASSSDRCTGGKCCVFRSECRCGPFDSCSSDETEVAECNLNVVTCSGSQVNVPSCSLRTP